MSLHGERCTVIIPCMNREDHLIGSIPQWLEQTYHNMQLVIVDYSSARLLADKVFESTNKYGASFLYNYYNAETDVVLLRIDNQQYFNLAHAYNYAVTRIESTVVSLACADSCPFDYYLDVCLNMLEENCLVQIHQGLFTLNRSLYLKLNGFQEFGVGWGAEEDDFRQRAHISGARIVSLPKHLVYQIPNNRQEKEQNRYVKDIFESARMNHGRFRQYISKFGYKGNYGEPIGQNQPVEFKFMEPNESVCLNWAQFVKNPDTMPDNVIHHKELNIYYTKSNMISWQTYAQENQLEIVKTGSILVDENDDLDRILLQAVNYA